MGLEFKIQDFGFRVPDSAGLGVGKNGLWQAWGHRLRVWGMRAWRRFRNPKPTRLEG